MTSAFWCIKNSVNCSNKKPNVQCMHLCTYIWKWRGASFHFILMSKVTNDLTCLLRNLYAVQEATVRTGHGTTDCFQIGKGIRQGCILSPCFFKLYAEHTMRNTGLEKAQDGIKIAGRNTNNLRYADDTTLMAKKWRRTKESLESEKGEWKSWLKTQHSIN